MPKTFSQLVESVTPAITELNDDFFNYVKAIKFNQNEITIQQHAFEYGEYIFNHGEFQLRHLCPKNSFSFSLILEHGCETFLEGEKFTPLHISLPGDVILIDQARGIKPIFPQENLNMTAGARSICVSAKISDSLSFMRLAKYYQLNPDVPKSLISEWAMLCQLARNAGSTWRARVLVISISNDVFFSERCNRLRHALRQSVASYQSLLETKFRFDFDTKEFMKRNTHKTHQSTMEHVKQLLFISKSHVPGFAFATDELLAPINLFKEAFIKIYGIPYTPSIVQPGHPAPDRPCYYPLQNT